MPLSFSFGSFYWLYTMLRRANLDTVALATTVEVERRRCVLGITRNNITGPEATLPDYSRKLLYDIEVTFKERLLYVRTRRH